MYIIVAVAMLAMMIPMAVPVSAQGESLTIKVWDIQTQAWVDDGNGTNEAYNLSGSLVQVTAVGFTPTSWTLDDQTTAYVDGINYGPAYFDPVPLPTDPVAYVRGVWGEAAIRAHFGTGPSDYVQATKKWGYDLTTSIQGPGSKWVTWNKASKSWSASATIMDTVYADFIDNNVHVIKTAQGAILNWYLVNSTAVIPAPDYAPALKTAMAALASGAATKAQYVQFIKSSTQGFSIWNKTSPGWLGTGGIQSTTGTQGTSSVDIGAWGEEAVKIVVIPEYPSSPNTKVVPEVTSYNFATYEMEVVPQVRWVGEKIVLDANFGLGADGDVNFYLQNSSIGTLEALDDDSEADTVWTETDNGTASVILNSLVSGQADVVAALYEYGPTGPMTNQMAFRVYFLNFESLVLSDVGGKRAQHNAGLWTPANPYNENFPNGLAADDYADYQLLNVSQDALERVQVRGWFVPPVNTQMSTRPAAYIDIDADGVSGVDPVSGEPLDLDDVLAPAGRWVLPDDWARIGGYTNWQERRLHWDIMDDPSDLIFDSLDMIGPFTPGVEFMTPSGWDNPKTVRPNTKLDAWDAPMPPAKIILEVMSGVGYFKDAYKQDIYYTNAPGKVLTQAFYKINIPANSAIPAYNAQGGGGYDWYSFDGTHGPYEFWKIFNRPTTNTMTRANAMHPTKIEIYSDNHGEAMAYLNGNWNLDLGKYAGKGGADVPLNDTVGFSTIMAMADYPYIRADQAIVSNTVEKEWYWSGQILGTDSHDFGTDPISQLPIAAPTDAGYTKMVLTAGNYQIVQIGSEVYPDQFGTSYDKVIWVWACDRDGLIDGVLGTTVQWRVTGGAYIPNVNADRISNYNYVTTHIPLVGGFVYGGTYNNNGTPADWDDDILTGVWGDGTILNADRTMAVSTMRRPSVAEKQLFHKKWPLLYTDATGAADINFAVAAIDIYSAAELTDVTVEEILTGPDFGYNGLPAGNVYYETNVDFTEAYPIDDPIKLGDANADGVVDSADITQVENIIMGLAAPNVNADTNQNGYIDMGDVVKISRIILGLE